MQFSEHFQPDFISLPAAFENPYRAANRIARSSILAFGLDGRQSVADDISDHSDLSQPAYATNPWRSGLPVPTDPWDGRPMPLEEEPPAAAPAGSVLKRERPRFWRQGL